MLRETRPLTDSYLGAELEVAFELTGAGRRLFASPANFVAAVERITAERGTQRARHLEVARVKAEVVPMTADMQLRASHIGFRLITLAEAITPAMLDGLPPALAKLEVLLEDAKSLAPAYAECREQIAHLYALSSAEVTTDPISVLRERARTM